MAPFPVLMAGWAMTHRAWLPAVALMAACGCATDPLASLWPDAPLSAVPDRPFSPVPTGPLPTIAHAPATEAAMRRVGDVAQRILAANPELPIRPLFLAVGSPEPEVFHRDDKALFISDAMVNKCATEPQLAAVLCNELGKMVATRQALLALKARRLDGRAPADLPIGQERGGLFGGADGTHLAELGKYEQSGGRGPGDLPATPPDPQLLARTYLKKAGFAPTDLDGVAPLLHEAEKHTDHETQLTGQLRPFVGQ
jgi:hypothetical protein